MTWHYYTLHNSQDSESMKFQTDNDVRWLASPGAHIDSKYYWSAITPLSVT